MHQKFFKCEGCGDAKPVIFSVISSPRFCWTCFLNGVKKAVAIKRADKEESVKARARRPNFTQFKEGDIISVNGVGPYTVMGVDGWHVEFNTGYSSGWADANANNLKKHEIKRQPILL
jgi:hypothetical protein